MAASEHDNVLTHKIAGKVPVWVVAVALVGIYYWYTHYGPGASSSATGSSAIDPSTGQPYAAELAAADQEIADLQNSSGGTGSGTGSGSGTPPPPPPPGPKPPIPFPPRPHGHGHRRGHKPPYRQAYQQVWIGGKHAKFDLQQIARQYGLTEAQLTELNPQLKKYVGSRKPVPVHMQITVPAPKLQPGIQPVPGSGPAALPAGQHYPKKQPAPAAGQSRWRTP